MNDAIVDTNKGLYIKLIFIKIIEFFLFYVRNIFLVTAAMFIFLVLVVIFTFYQDELNIDPIKNVILFVDNSPIIGNMIEMPTGNIHIDENDLGYFF